MITTESHVSLWHFVVVVSLCSKLLNVNSYLFPSPPPQILSPLLDLNQNRSKLKLYISHLTSLCQERDPIILQDFAPPPAYHRTDSASWHTQLHSMTQEQVGHVGGERVMQSVCLCLHVFL